MVAKKIIPAAGFQRISRTQRKYHYSYDRSHRPPKRTLRHPEGLVNNPLFGVLYSRDLVLGKTQNLVTGSSGAHFDTLC